MRFGTCSLTFRTRLAPGDLYIRRQATHHIFECDFEVVPDVLAALYTRPLAPAASKNISEAKQIPENIFKATEGRFVEAGESSASINRLMAVTIVSCAFLRIAEDSIGFGCLFELLFCFPITRITVRMVLERKLAICAL